MKKEEAYIKTKELILSNENKIIHPDFYRGYLMALFNFNLISMEEKTDLNNTLNNKG